MAPQRIGRALLIMSRQRRAVVAVGPTQEKGLTRMITVRPPQRLGQCAIGGPSCVYPRAQGGAWQSDALGPCRKGEGLAVVRQVVSPPLIAKLSGDGGPTDVAGLIAGVVVDAVQGVVGGGRRSHVGQECLKRIVPAVTNPNPASTVVSIGLVVGVVAPTFHPVPRTVLLRSRLPMCRQLRAAHVATQTATTTGAALSQLGRFLRDHRSAIALTLPKAMPWAARSRGDNQQAAKALAHQVSITTGKRAKAVSMAARNCRATLFADFSWGSLVLHGVCLPNRRMKCRAGGVASAARHPHILPKPTQLSQKLTTAAMRAA